MGMIDMHLFLMIHYLLLVMEGTYEKFDILILFHPLIVPLLCSVLLFRAYRVNANPAPELLYYFPLCVIAMSDLLCQTHALL